MNTRHRWPLACMTAICLTLGGIAGCAKQDAATFVASAKTYMAKRDYKAAIIEIKNALQREPDNAEARLLLATSLMDSGDPAGAEAEVRKAISASAPDDFTYPLLARALIAQGDFKKVTTELIGRKLGTPAARAELGIALATATAAQGDPRRAKNLVTAALAEQPENVKGRLLQAQLAAQTGDMPAARNYVDAILKGTPDDVDALMMKAQIEAVGGNRDEAQKLYEQAVAVRPESIVARFPLASLAVTSGKYDIAKAQVAKMKELQPRDFRTVYSDALVSYATGDARHARDAIAQVLAGRPDHLPSVFLSSLIDFQLGSNASAEASLRKVLARAPEDANAGRVLALVYLRSGRATEALEVLKPVLLRNPGDALLLRTAGEAYLASGNAAQAAASYERANAIDKANVGSQVRLAQVRLAAGETERAFGDLQAMAKADSSAYQADLALITEHLRRRQFGKALAAVDALEKKQPTAALVPSVRGGVYLAMRDLAKARKSFEKALEMNPEYYSAAYNLAILDVREGQPEAAQQRFDRMLAKNPKNEQVLLASADVLRLMGGTPEQVKAALQKAVDASPQSVASRLALIGHDLRRRDGNAAIASAQAALAAIPNDPQLLDALGAGQMMAGDVNQGINTLKRITQAQPQNPLAFMRLADAQLAAKDYSGAIESERKALALKPDLARASAGLARIYLVSGRPGEAIAEARSLQKAQPDKAIGYALEGEVLAAQRKWSEASLAFQAGLARQPAPSLAVGAILSLQRADKAADATALANKWMKEHPKDPAIPLVLAEQNQQRGNRAEAKSGYARVLDIDPDNAVALNNLAWLLTEDGDAKGLQYAERAHRLAPFNPNVLDTLGFALAKSGDAKRGAQLLRMASSLAPEQAEIRLHLAKVLVQSGDKNGARKELAELTKLEKLDKSSPIRAEAEKMQSAL